MSGGLSNLPPSLIAARIAHRVRAIVVEETCPVGTATRPGYKPGGLRGSIHVYPYADGYAVGTNLAYARAVHDGRKALVIRPRKRKALYWPGINPDHPVKQVRQKARKGNPFLRLAMEKFVERANVELPLLFPDLPEAARFELENNLRANGLQVTKG